MLLQKHRDCSAEKTASTLLTGLFYEKFVTWLQLLSLLQPIPAVRTERAMDSSGCYFRTRENGEMWSRKVSLSDVGMNLKNFTYITTKDVQLFSNCQSKCWQCTNVETLHLFVATLCFFRCGFLLLDVTVLWLILLGSGTTTLLWMLGKFWPYQF